MEKPLIAGVSLTLLAGVMSGNCMVPVKFVRSWAWLSPMPLLWASAPSLERSCRSSYYRMRARTTTLASLFWQVWH
jgi:hypothetical protein